MTFSVRYVARATADGKTRLMFFLPLDRCSPRENRHSVEYRLSAVASSLLVPPLERRREPEYFTVAGLVFVVLSEPYLRSEYGDRWDYDAPVKLLDRLFHGTKQQFDEQVVLLSQVRQNISKPGARKFMIPLTKHTRAHNFFFAALVT